MNVLQQVWLSLISLFNSYITHCLLLKSYITACNEEFSHSFSLHTQLFQNLSSPPLPLPHFQRIVLEISLELISSCSCSCLRLHHLVHLRVSSSTPRPVRKHCPPAWAWASSGPPYLITLFTWVMSVLPTTHWPILASGGPPPCLKAGMLRSNRLPNCSPPGRHGHLPGEGEVVGYRLRLPPVNPPTIQSSFTSVPSVHPTGTDQSVWESGQVCNGQQGL